MKTLSKIILIPLKKTAVNVSTRKKYDVLISPTMPIIAPKFSEISKLTPLENYMMDIMTVGPNLAGLPHLSVNAGFIGKMPVGLMVIGNHLDDNKVLKFGEKIE